MGPEDEGVGKARIFMVPLGPDGEPDLSAMTEARGSTFSWGEGSGFEDSSRDDNGWGDMIVGQNRTSWSMDLKKSRILESSSLC